MPPVWHQGDEDACSELAGWSVYEFTGGGGCTPVSDLQACLSDGSPVVFGCTLFESFATEPAVLAMPADDEPVLGPHAMVVVGIGYGHEWVDYPDADPHTRYVKVRNSWGTDAHHGGHLLIPTDYLVRYGADFWTIRSA
jgi:C1A family cysteine protease